MPEHTIRLLNRDFPMVISDKEAEELQTAAGLIEDRIQEYRHKFKVTDEIFLVLMACLDFAHDQIRQSEEAASHEEWTAVDELLNKMESPAAD